MRNGRRIETHNPMILNSKWTRERSIRANTAKERLRIQRAQAEPEIDRVKCPVPRKPAADFTITVKAKSGERVQVSVWRFYNRCIISDGIKSVRQLCRGLEQLITKSAI